MLVHEHKIQEGILFAVAPEGDFDSVGQARVGFDVGGFFARLGKRRCLVLQKHVINARLGKDLSHENLDGITVLTDDSDGDVFRAIVFDAGLVDKLDVLGAHGRYVLGAQGNIFCWTFG